MTMVTIIQKNGQPVTVDETKPGMFGELGYKYADTPTGLPQLPTGGGGAPSSASTLPAGGKPSGLLSFASGLQEAVNLAKQHRNKGSFDLMKPHRGTAMASDFNSILGNMNRASDTFSSDLVKQATAVSEPDILTATDDNGNVTGIDRATGQVVWKAPGVGNKQGSGGGGNVVGDTYTSGDLIIPVADVLAGNEALRFSSTQGPEADGKYADPAVYLKMYQKWVVTSKGKASDFLKQYPIDTWVNPLSRTAVSEQLTKYNSSGSSRSS